MQHVVSQPTPPFKTADGRLEIHQIPAWIDNLIWLAVCTRTGAGVIIDGPEAGPVLDYCAARGIALTGILNTHTHPDHIGINRQLLKAGHPAAEHICGPAGAKAPIPGLTRAVDEGDRVHIGAVEGEVWRTEGHQDGHLSYRFDDVVFCGDTLFGAGCGYLFDGPPAKMHASLQRLAALPGPTRVCCAHEYTEDNLRFAWHLEPDNEALAARIRDTWALRAAGGCTVPSTIALERATNPFLRGAAPALRARLQALAPHADLSDPAATFAATRALKDAKIYRDAVPDTALPLGGPP